MNRAIVTVMVVGCLLGNLGCTERTTTITSTVTGDTTKTTKVVYDPATDETTTTTSCATQGETYECQ
jgi:hypothetical protein